MYAWDIAVAANKLNLLNVGPPHSPLIAQPPHDTATGNASMYHYTWGAIFKEGGREVWKFDKRFYTAADDALKVCASALQTLPLYFSGEALRLGA